MIVPEARPICRPVEEDVIWTVRIVGEPAREPELRAVAPPPHPLLLLVRGADPGAGGEGGGQEVVGLLVRDGGEVPAAGGGGLAELPRLGPGFLFRMIFVAQSSAREWGPAIGTLDSGGHRSCIRAGGCCCCSGCAA